MEESDHGRLESEKHRVMIEDIAVTPFFKKHKGHMAATLKLHAEIIEDDDYVILETLIKGYEEHDIKVSATENTIDITLVLEKNDAGGIQFHNSYFTPSPIEADEIKIEHIEDILKITIPKK